MHVRLGFGLLAVLACAVMGIFSAAARAEGSCPNEALRQELRSGQLPDCRAYEMVSPVFKDGANATIEALSGDGSHVIAVAFGAFAGTEGEQFDQLVGPVYEFSRTGSGWVTTPLDPPASRFPALEFQGASRDLTRTLWVLREPLQSIHEGDLYVREPDGRFVKVGPLVGGESGPPGGSDFRVAAGLGDFYAGASADLSHVIISHEANSHLLYEYVGTGVAGPELVGVNDEGKQVSDCGTTLGGAINAQEGYNAISSNGERVFFTASDKRTESCAERLRAIEECENEGKSSKECEEGIGLRPVGPEVNELYARINRSETVAISEPSLLQCEECQTGHTKTPTPEKPAEFQGASEDGSKVYFTTEQELLPGQHTENLYEFDFNRLVGKQIVLASKGSSNPEVQGVARVSEDGSHAYFVAKGVLTTALNREGGSPKAESDNLYLFERDASYPQGRVAFIATLPEADNEDWREADSRPAQATTDGRFLVFDSGSQVFEYDAKEEMLVNVSMGHAATIASPSFSEQSGARPSEAQYHLAVSSDGAYVLFNLSSENGLSEYHSVGAISNGNMYPISGQDVPLESAGGKPRNARIDASGSDVFFDSLKSLVAADTNSGEDIYDARVAGGFPEPAGPVACEGEACQGARSSVPLFGSAGSSSATGGGNLAPAVESKLPAERTKTTTPKPVKCKKRLVRKKNKCVRKKKSKKARKASRDRRAKS
jgi:hypothetical protein